jgi:hypothetical protein
MPAAAAATSTVDDHTKSNHFGYHALRLYELLDQLCRRVCMTHTHAIADHSPTYGSYMVHMQ